MAEDNKDKNKDEIDIDDFLDLDDEGVFEVQESVAKAESEKVGQPEEQTETTETTTVSASDFSKELEGDLPQLCGNGYPPEYLQMVERAYVTYRMLPKLEYGAIYRELADLSIASSPTPTLQVLNDEIQKVQGSKDRLSEIMVKVLECHNVKKRLVDTLTTAWGKFSSEKNAEARKGDSIFRLSSFSMDLAKAESLLKVCTHILKNLDSLHDSLSRRITINQLLLKMNDMGRGSLPDYNLQKQDMRVNEADLFGEEKKEIDPSEGLEASVENW